MLSVLWLLYIVAAATVGCLLGILTGLIPGLHVNTVALLLLAVTVPLLNHRPADLGVTETLTLLVAGIGALSISHTFHDYLPSALLGAPAVGSELTVLPAHRLLQLGEARRGFRSSMKGSAAAILITAGLFPALYFLSRPPLDLIGSSRPLIPWALLALVVILIWTEGPGWPKRLIGLVFFVLCGAFGLVILALPLHSVTPLPPTALFPALSGLFGVAGLLDSLEQNQTPEQHSLVPGSADRTQFPLRGGALGFLVGLFPGVTSSQAAIFALGEDLEEDEVTRCCTTVTTLSAVNTANAMAVLAFLFLLGRTRSGAAIAINQLMGSEAWISGPPPQLMVVTIFAAVVAAAVSCWTMPRLGEFLLTWLQHLPYRAIIFATIVGLMGLVWLFTGFIGLLILLLASALGQLPSRIGIRRSLGMGVLLIPILCFLFGIR